MIVSFACGLILVSYLGYAQRMGWPVRAIFLQSAKAERLGVALMIFSQLSALGSLLVNRAACRVGTPSTECCYSPTIIWVGEPRVRLVVVPSSYL